MFWFDSDRYDRSSDANLKSSIAAKSNVYIYMSQPCVENWILAHFQPINLSEAQCQVCENKIKQKHISNYRKNDCNMLKKYIDKQKVKRAIAHYPEIGEIPQQFFL